MKKVSHSLPSFLSKIFFTRNFVKGQANFAIGPRILPEGNLDALLIANCIPRRRGYGEEGITMI